MPIVLTALAAGVLAGPPPASSAECTKETRPLALGEGTAAIRSYLCRGDQGEKVRVAFHRLDEISTISLFRGEPIAPLRTILGDAAIEKNRLYTRLDDVFSRFAKSPKYDHTWNYSMAVPGGGSGTSGRLGGKVWRLGNTSFIPLTREVGAIRNGLTFPSGLSFFYVRASDKCRQWPLTCTIVWRAMTEADVVGYEEDMRRHYADRPYDPSDMLTDNYLKMLAYLSQGRWPKHLEFVHGRFDECGQSFVFSYIGRHLLFDVAVIENLTDRELPLDALWGVRSPTDTLRPSGEDSGAPAELTLETKALPPKGKLIVPLRFRLVPRTSDIDRKDLAEARKVHAQVKRGRKNQVVGASQWHPGFEKKRGAFGPPSTPRLKNFVYGEAIDLKGLVLDGDGVLLEGTSANYLEVTMAYEGASCPYLYSWNEETNAFERHGQVLVRANDASKLRSETIVFPGLRNRFELREEELEVTYLDHVALTLHLDDGRTVTKRAKTPKLAEADGDFIMLYPGQVAPLTFATDEIEAETVEKSALTVTGFYIPFSRFMTPRIASPARGLVPAKQDSGDRHSP